MRHILPVLFCLLLLAGCLRFEVRVTKIYDAQNNTTVRVPPGDRLSVILQGKWYNKVQFTEKPSGIEMLGRPDNQENLVNGRLTQFTVVNFSIRNSGKLTFTYDYPPQERRTYSVQVENR